YRRIGGVEVEPLVGIERSQVVEVGAVADRIGIVVIDRADLGQREVPLAVLRRADLALDRVAGPQAPFADLVGGDVDVVGAGEIVRFGAAEEAEAVLQHLDRALADDFLAVLGHFLENREHQVLPAHRRRAFDLILLGHGDQLGRRPFLQFFQMHLGSPVLRWEPAGRSGLEKADPAARNGGLSRRSDKYGVAGNASIREWPGDEPLVAIQNGLTTTSTTISATATPGTSLSILSCLPESGRSPFASLRRSEEHTSELQSRENLVCRLL